MPLTYAYDAALRLVRSRAEGVLDVNDFRAYTRRILDDAQIQPGFIEALVIDPETDMRVRYADLSPFRHIWKEYLAKGVRGTLIQATSDVGFGIFRMFESTIASEDVDPDRAFELVRSAEEMDARIAQIRSRFPSDLES